MPGPSLHGEFLRHAVLDTVVPHASDVDIEAALTSSLEGGAGDLTSVLSSIPQRSLLFFVRIVLRLSNCSEDALKAHLPRLDVRLDAFVINPSDPGTEGSTPTKDLIFSGTVNEKEDPLVVVNVFEGDEGSGNHVYVTWKIQAFLNRPRVRIQHPCVIFSASATLNPPERAEQASQSDEYLPSLIPASSNVLEALSADPLLRSANPFLPASRLLRVVPATQTEDPIYNIWQQAQHPIRIVPAANARIRCSRLNTFSSWPTTIASLDFEVTPFLNCDVVFDKAELALSDGHVENLSNVPELKPPITCRPRDDVTLVYKLIPEYGPESNPSTTAMVSTLDISLEAVIQVSDDCKPRISMQWRTNVDFSMPLNPTFGGPSQVLQRNNRPSSLSMTSGQGGTSSGVPPLKRSSFRERAHSITQSGVTISFSGPVDVEVSKPFRWDVFIVNRSMTPRKFAMIAIPRRKRVDPRKHVARPSSSSTSSRKEEQLAEAVTDESIIHAMQKNAAGQDADLISLSTDIRVGPLLPGTCHSTELVLLPLTTGSLHLEAVRLVDLNTNETTDIRDLPDIVVSERRLS
ncbi:hypothetical protein T310_9492 [Rasamsonia emersonii CBS 393.64]|uniref:Trafficking protein particle complex II-specific subunit 65 IgD3 domain-containing protein n=1 Tax=Rasamsonia emersonii (strain ATCC 16479 / CBS 393.64 / IMI 116815) TaxID=1408163 RepID=A0A0F4YGW7_RASE3|nr:hypothetical protein T310_9492 [Rasamsonia emersonii CBS 393.64]KKA16878.1 hypothetical protein T310_9492 [Rasamsonia emersonii CBS 393.64]